MKRSTVCVNIDQSDVTKGGFTYNQHFVAMMNVINVARLNPPDKGHKHHIVPKCWFKVNNLPVDNSDDNLVLLTYEDHCKVHKLMTLCTDDEDLRRRYIFAYTRVTNGSVLGLKHSAQSRAKMSYSARHRKSQRKGFHLSEERRKQISESQKGRVPWNKGKHGIYSEETLAKMKIANSHVITDEQKLKISKALTGIKRSDDTKSKMSNAVRGCHYIIINGKKVRVNKEIPNEVK